MGDHALPDRSTCTLVKIITGEGVFGVGAGSKHRRELAVAALIEVCTGI